MKMAIGARTTAPIGGGEKGGERVEPFGWARPSLIPRRHTHYSSRATRNSGVVRMARTESVVLDVGFEAPEFALPEPLTGNVVSLREYTKGSKATMIMIICNHCPFVVHLKPAIVELAKEYQPLGVSFVAVSSNSVQTHPQDGPEQMAEDAKASGYTFPYVYDETQEVAKAYQAACTPEFMVFDENLKLQYHGQFDDSRPAKYGESPPLTGKDIRNALDKVLAGAPVDKPWKPSIGCNVKWIPGKEPAWYG